MNSIIRTEHLRKEYGGLVAVKDACLDLKAGEVVSLLGASGSGKSTLLGLLAGLESPTAGRVELDGVELGGLSEDRLALLRREKVGFVFQAFHLIPTLPALENVAFPLYPTDMPVRERTERARDLLDKVGLSGRRGNLPGTLSGGERQRVAIARALVNSPKLIFCDEPTGNLDSATGQEIVRLLLDLNRARGASLFLVTHDRTLAARADRIFTMHDGEVVEQ